MAEGRKEDSVSQNLGVLLIEFLNLYGNTFNYRDVGISVLEGGYYFKKISKAGNWINPARYAVFCNAIHLQLASLHVMIVYQANYSCGGKPGEPRNRYGPQ